MRKMLFVFFLSFGPAIAGLKAQELSANYIDSVRHFFNSAAFTDWIQRGFTGQRNTHPMIVHHPLGHPNPSPGQYSSFTAIFTRKSHTVVYHWTPRLPISGRDTVMIKTDSLVFTEQEKVIIMNSMTNLSTCNFNWTNDYFANATFPVQFADSLFTGSKNAPEGLYAFSMPVFLRNYSYCVFNYAWVIRGGGHSSYEVYKKINGQKWCKYGEFGGGDW
jgi:hypothetical protein